MTNDDAPFPPEDEPSELEKPAAPAAPEPPFAEPVAALSAADDEADAEGLEEVEPAATAMTGTLPEPPRAPSAPRRPDLADRRDPLYRECRGYRLRLDPPDLARLRELPGSRGKTDTEIGESFFDGQADRLAASIVDDVPSGSEVRVVVDPYSRQAFLALENRIRGILSF
ncbi:MAG TPA: hypothetical protein VMN82_09950 [Thermoanaerobaculia bacterium]|nr:hypothetical protein [Thermoanaerobaculia bacterium]